LDGKRLANLSTFCTELGVKLYLQADGSVSGTATLQKGQEGAPLYVHGGVLAALLDEAMAGVLWASGRRVMSVNLTLNYRKPAPSGIPLTIIGRIDSAEGRKHFTLGQVVLPNGDIAVEATGIFVEVPQMFDDLSEPFAHVPED
jgi:acyl-coenzyme A thioesterase PaaI-like protein